MTDGPRRRRRRMLLVLLLGVGVAAWAIRRKLGDRHGLDDGWQPLPPRPSSAPTDAQATPAEPTPPASVPPTAPREEPAPTPGATVLPADEPAASDEAPAEATEPKARAVPAAAAVASVAVPALPDAPFGPGSLRALADGSSPDPDYAIKGKTATKVFHAPGGAYYTRTRADVWFRTARDARAAGFTERTRRKS